MVRLSHSQIDMFNQCKRWWYFAYQMKIKVDSDMRYARRGSVVHEVAEYIIKEKPQTIEQVKEKFKECWLNYKLDDDFRGKEQETWMMCVNLFNNPLQLTDTEMKLYSEDPHFICYVDGVNSKDHTLIDYKTSTWTSDEAYKMQMAFYSLFYNKKFGVIPKSADVIYVKYFPFKYKKYSFTQKELNEYENLIINTNNFMEKNKGSMKEFKRCLDEGKKCGFFCPYGDVCEKAEAINNFTICIKRNYLTVQGNLTPILLTQLKKKFSYELKDAYFIKKRNPYACTTISFWNDKYKTLHIGFLDGLKKTLNDYIEYKKLSGKVIVKDERTFDEKKIDMPDKLLSGKVLRDYQDEAVNIFLGKKLGILEVGTGAGKTLMATECVRYIESKTLFIVNRVELMKQTKQVFEENLGIEIGQIGDSKIEPKSITVATIQTLIKHKQKLGNYLNQVRFAIWDECLSKYSQIMLCDGQHQTIEEVYNNDNITKVMSFNEKKQIFEEKEIVRKIKQPMNDCWWNLVIIDELGNKHKLVLTQNHKIWTSNGYKQVKDLTVDDELKVNLSPKKYVYKICNKIYKSSNSLGYCASYHNDPNQNKKASILGCKAFKLKMENSIFKKNFINKCKNAKELIKNKPSYIKNMKMMGEKRKGMNNPVFNRKETIQKIRNTQKRNFQNKTNEEQKEQIKKFNSSYRIMPQITKPEQMIIDMNIKTLIYNGVEKNFIYKFKNNKWKIPDFKINGENKVIEVSDFEYWRTKKEAEQIIKNYKQIGIKCLYLDKLELYNNYDNTKKKIEKFCFNHKAKILFIKKTRKNKKSFKYNLEIKDNHNYIANRILVSNCHNAPSKSYQTISNYLGNTEFRLGLTATNKRDDGNDMAITAVVGYPIFKLTSRELIERGQLIDPYIIFFKDYMTDEYKTEVENNCVNGLINPTQNYHEFYNAYIVNNKQRNNQVKKMCDEHLTSKILILVKSVEHGKILSEILGCEYLHGSVNKKERKKIFDDFKKDINLLVATISIMSEGVDIPVLEGVINASANKGDIKTIQSLGRELRLFKGKNSAFYYDFVDYHNFFKYASYSRKRALQSEGYEVTIRKVKSQSI